MDKIIPAKTWTKEEIELATNLAARGLTASEIGKELNRSRNAVIGAVHRNKIKLLTKTDDRPKNPRPPRLRRGDNLKRVFLASPDQKKVNHEPPPAIPPNKENYVPFLDRRFSQCKYIVEKRGTTHYCCGNPVDRKGWCAYHAAIVYRPIDPKPINRDGQQRTS